MFHVWSGLFLAVLPRCLVLAISVLLSSLVLHCKSSRKPPSSTISSKLTRVMSISTRRQDVKTGQNKITPRCQDRTKQDNTRQDNTRKDKNNTGKDKTKQDKTRQHKHHTRINNQPSRKMKNQILSFPGNHF